MSHSQSERVVGVIGLGYVGLPVAVAFGKKFRTIGFDIQTRRIEELKRGYDRTHEVQPSELSSPLLSYSSSIEELKAANFFIVCVPTPIDEAKQPDLGFLTSASQAAGQALKHGDIVVYESTVYPGVTEEHCIPVLERVSGLRAGLDFKVGYSPERINPGDKTHGFTEIKKVVSAQDADSLATVKFMYESVVTAGIFCAESIKVAEAAKVIENTQRDLNIALMNELSVIFDRMNIRTQSVLEAAATKWNFLKFTPGLVGGHCIGVDPYYLTHQAEKIGYHPEVILAGRRINDSMGKFIAQKTIKLMIGAGHTIHNSSVTILGLTFKEDCPDLRNTRVIDIIRELKEYGVEVQISDPLADPEEALHEYGLRLTPFAELKPSTTIIVAVAHRAFKELSAPSFSKLMHSSPILIDVKGIYGKQSPQDDDSFQRAGIQVWSL